MNTEEEYERTLSPREWLAYKRKRHGCDVPFRWSEGIDILIQQIPPEKRESAKKIWESRVGKTIGEIHEEQFQEYFDRLVPVLTESQKSLVDKTYFGLYPTYKFNGYAGSTPKGDRVVMLHAGLPHSIAIWSHQFVRQMEQGGGISTLENNLPSYIKILEYFASTWTGNTTKQVSGVYPDTVDGWGLSEELTIAAICFVIGHEMGHVELDHRGYSNNVTENHEMEFAADLYGLELCIRYTMLHMLRFNDNYYTMMMLFGPFLAFGVIALLGSTDSRTHPSVFRRRDSLIKNFPVVLKNTFKDDFDAFVEEVNPDLINVIDGNSRGIMMIGKILSDELGPLIAACKTADCSWINKSLYQS